MEMLKALQDINEFKTDRLRELLIRGAPTYVHYGQESDTFRILFVSPETETFVYYLDDDDVALIVGIADSEVVGFHIESFQRRFLPAHAGVKRVWQLSRTDLNRTKDFGDLILQFEKAKRQAAREIVNATREIILEKHRELGFPAYV